MKVPWKKSDLREDLYTAKFGNVELHVLRDQESGFWHWKVFIEGEPYAMKEAESPESAMAACEQWCNAQFGLDRVEDP